MTRPDWPAPILAAARAEVAERAARRVKLYLDLRRHARCPARQALAEARRLTAIGMPSMFASDERRAVLFAAGEMMEGR